MPSVCYIHISAPDELKAKKFYETLFGWTINEKQMGPYKFQEIADTWPSSTYNKIEGSISAPMPGEKHHSGITMYIDVENIDETLKKVTENEGSVTMEKNAIPGEGYLAACKDPFGNSFGLWQSDSSAQ